MTVQLLLVFLFEAKYYLSWNYPFVGVFKMQVRIEGKRSSVFEQVGSYFLFIDRPFHVVSGLIDPKECKTIENARMDLFATVGDDTYDNLSKCVSDIVEQRKMACQLFPKH